MKKSGTFLLLLALWASPAFSDQTRLARYEPTARKVFWEKLYSEGGSTLYCGLRFKDRIRLQVEHVYAASWMGEHLGCGNREQCRKKSARFNFMEADLHNLYPELDEVNRARSNFFFGIIEGESQTPRKQCEFKFSRALKRAQPRKLARGNIARSIFYMHSEYGLPIERDMLQLLKTWNREDRVALDEIRRNREIELLQGTRNGFIDKPQLADRLE